MVVQMLISMTVVRKIYVRISKLKVGIGFDFFSPMKIDQQTRRCNGEVC